MSNMLRVCATTLLVGALAFGVTGCAVNERGLTNSDNTGITGIFGGAGASSQEAAQAAWIAAFQMKNGGATINYSPVGSGAGRKQFMEGAVAYAGSDSYLSRDELTTNFAACAEGSAPLSLPVYVSPIAVPFNLEGIDRLQLDAKTLAQIFTGEIATWNDPRIVELNPETELPPKPITAVYRSDDSGSTKNFAAYMQANSPDVWQAEPADKYPYAFAGAEGAQGTSGVMAAISGGDGTIGYADASKVGAMPTISLKVGDDFVLFSAEGAAITVAASPLAEGRPAQDMAIDIDYATSEPGAYPLLLVSYLLVCEQYQDPLVGEFVQEFASYVISDEGQALAAKHAGSAPVSTQTGEALRRALDSVH